MRRIVSVRLGEATLEAARLRAKRENRTLTNYIESVVQGDLAANPAGRHQVQGRPGVSRVLRVLRAHRADLERMGVVHASIIGSVARGEDRPDSDVDIVVEVDPAAVRSIFAYGGIQQSLAEWIGRPVDLAGKDRLRPGVAAEAERDQIVAF